MDVENEIHEPDDFYKEVSKVSGLPGGALQNYINAMVERELWRFPVAVDLAASSRRSKGLYGVKRERTGRGGNKSSRGSSDGAARKAASVASCVSSC